MDVLDSIAKADPIRGRLLREALPYVPTRKGGVSKEMASFLRSCGEEGMEAAVSAGDGSTVQLPRPWLGRMGTEACT